MSKLQFVLVSLTILLFLAAPALAIAQDDPTPAPDFVAEGDTDTLRVQNQPTQELFTNTPEAVTPAPAIEQTPIPTPDQLPADEAPPIEDPALVALAFWFAMAGAVTGFLEQFKAIILKPAQAYWKFSDQWYSGITMAVAYLTALVLVMTVGEGRTIFDAIGLNISNQIVAQFATAFVVSLGNQALHQLYNLFAGWRTPVLAIEEHREVVIPAVEPKPI